MGMADGREVALSQAAQQPSGIGRWQAAPLHLLLCSRLPLALPGAEQASLAPAQQGGSAASRVAEHLHIRHAACWRVSSRILYALCIPNCPLFIATAELCSVRLDVQQSLAFSGAFYRVERESAKKCWILTAGQHAGSA